MPVQVGIQKHLNLLGSRLRGNDVRGDFRPPLVNFLGK